MNQFNEGKKAKEERRKYQKTAQVLTLFIVSYVAQWLPFIIFCTWSFIAQPPTITVRELFIFTHIPTMFYLKEDCNWSSIME